MKVAIIHARDHFSSELRADQTRCIAEFVGIILGEDEEYICLRHIKADIDDSNSAEEYHNILKKAIVKQEILSSGEEE